ncbi:sulfatase-like hydrolase/transferase [Novosphingobium mangrovi (ex Huang et al. 2023)]|uniref:Sulfatase N-terminal domain-containing protein n=1 Tax=Novosphingobium mangrovi (ex Huang et al. 2023) TaxID=2976432 RepID=A0ABT2I3Q7_9SPHN|nr:sulfatase-like hydrolase/transferase [Novosphingobium mangrovi (ex Huang et al. 2023)]MCT2399434.1 hypothetical protein [Novosphingobium mangrovi (ex Huang et al. 2023)]
MTSLIRMRPSKTVLNLDQGDNFNFLTALNLCNYDSINHNIITRSLNLFKCIPSGLDCCFLRYGMGGFGLFRHFSPKFAFWWIVIPNIGAIAMWPIGGPSMAVPIAICGTIALLMCQFDNRTARRIGIVTCFALSVMMYVAVSFNLEPLKVVSSMQYVTDIDISRSPEYVMACVIILTALFLALRYAPNTPKLLTREQRIMAVVAIVLLIDVDWVVTAGARGTYKMSAPAGTPIDSAVLQNHIAPKSTSARNLIVILVESLGVPNNAHDRALFDRAWGKRRWASRYEYSSGTSAYFGSTTNGELRELCGVWADYDRYDFDKANCLPKKFRNAGFHTTAIHAYQGDFFDRQTWYPKLGFQDRLFEPQLRARRIGRCGGVFAGACDADIPALIGKRLRNSPYPRNFVYWVTLNTHLPVGADEGLRTEHCQLSDAEWNEAFPMLCREYMLQQRLADALEREIMRADFPEADILIVGDHMPPFFPRAMRERFDTENVPWIMLRSRAAMRRSGSTGADPAADLAAG